MFHHFHRSGQPAGQGSITADTFSRMIEYVGSSNILPAEEWYKRALNKTLKEHHTCLTFDDSLKCQYEVALPVLEHYGLTAFFFVYSSVCEGNIENLEVYRAFRTEHFTDLDTFYGTFENAAQPFLEATDAALRLQSFRYQDYLTPYAFYTPGDRRFRFIRDELLGPDKYFAVMDSIIVGMGLSKQQLARNLWMTDSDLQALSDEGHMIGLHSYSHPTRLCELPIARQREEYENNFMHLNRITGVAPVSMSHPCNSYDAGTLTILREMGIRVGFCSNMGVVQDRTLLEVPRIDHADLLRELNSFTANRQSHEFANA